MDVLQQPSCLPAQGNDPCWPSPPICPDFSYSWMTPVFAAAGGVQLRAAPHHALHAAPHHHAGERQRLREQLLRDMLLRAAATAVAQLRLASCCLCWSDAGLIVPTALTRDH